MVQRDPSKKRQSNPDDEVIDVTREKKPIKADEITFKESSEEILIQSEIERKGWDKWKYKAKKNILSPFMPLFDEFYDQKEFADIKQPVLFLIRSSLDIDRFEGVRDGIFKIKADEKTGSEEESEDKGIILTNAKLLNLPCGKNEDTGEIQNLKCWIAYEDEAITYPLKPKYDSSVFLKMIEKIYMNAFMLNSDSDKKGGWGMMWEIGLGAVMVIAIITYVLFSNGFFDPVVTETVSEVAQQTIANVTESQAGVRIQ